MADAESVTLEVTALLLAQRQAAEVGAFNAHLSSLFDAFHDALTERWAAFEDARATTTPLLPFGAAGAETAEQRAEQLLAHLRGVAQDEVARFGAECLDVRRELDRVVANVEASARAAERRREDEVLAAAQLSRREVAATVAMMRTEQSQSAVEGEALKTAEAALARTAEELDRTRARLERALGDNAAHTAALREQLDEQRLAAARALEEERTAATAQLRQVMSDADRSRVQHAAELTEAHSATATAVERLRQDLARCQRELAAALREVDDLNARRTEDQRRGGAERVQLQKAVAEARLDAERARADAEVTQAQADLGVRRAGDQQRTADLQSFKTRLIASVAPASPVGSPMGRAASARDAPPVARGIEASPASRAPSASGAARSPSQAFMRLQALSAAWKDRIASA